MYFFLSYKISNTPNEKGDRACYRFSNHDCVVYDRSYYMFFILEGNNILELIQKYIIFEDFKVLKSYQNKNFKITNE